MPIAYDGKIYEDSYNLEQGRPVEAPGEDKKQGGTQVPPVENNAPAGNVEAVRGILRPDLTQSFNTPLTPEEQKDYNTKFSPQDSFDYDMQGWYKANPGADPKGEGVHYPDTFKKPNHMTFSSESQYSNDQTPGGTWSTQDGQDVYTPSSYNLNQIGPDNLKKYFETTEKNSKLNILPDVGAPIIQDGGQISSGTTIGNAIVQRNEDVLKGIVKSVIQGVQAPGDALQGKLPTWAVDPETGEVHTSPQVIEKAQDLAQFAVLGPAPVAAKMADGTLGSFIGVKAKTFDRNGLGGAQIMESNGVNPDKIFKETGMFRGADNRWRQEIPDKDSKLNKDWHMEGVFDDTKVTSTLPEVLDHPELYKAYPQLKDVKVEYDPSYTGAYFSPQDNKIVMGKDVVNYKEVYLHEIQHAIQGIEGFNKGGSPLRNPRLRFEEDLDKLQLEMKDLIEKHRTVGLDDKDLDRISTIQKIGALNTLRKKAAYNESLKNYMRLAGEVEARNVETRSALGSEHRNYYPPYSEDTPRREQFVVDRPVYSTPYGLAFDPNEPPPR